MALVTSPDQVMLSCDSLLVAILVAGVYVDLSLVVGHGERVNHVRAQRRICEMERFLGDNNHCMLIGAQKVPIRSEYTSKISSKNALIWYIKHLGWTRVSNDLSTFWLANHEVARPKIVSFARHLAIDIRRREPAPIPKPEFCSEFCSEEP